MQDAIRLARLANDNLVSVGASLGHVHIPGRKISEDTVPHDEVEIGMGIHNEPGSQRVKANLEDLVSLLLRQLLDSNDPDRGYLGNWSASTDQFVLLINNLGGLSVLELSGITGEVSAQLEKDYKIRPVRAYQGTFLTSLNSPGFSISLLRLADTGLGPGKSMVDFLDAPAEAIGWSAPVHPSTWELQNYQPVLAEKVKPAEEVPSNVKGKCVFD